MYAKGIDGNYSHLFQRANIRISPSDKQTFEKALNGLQKRLKSKAIPNAQWYRKVLNNGIPVGYICGQGTYISTVLSVDMIPKGVSI